MHLFGGAAAKAKTAAAPANASPHIKDGRLETFAQDVIQTSMTTPVLVDFWAPWCGPCKQLTPTLEKVVNAAKGKVKLVKINIDDEPELAQQLRIQSVPTVYAFMGGQPVTGFAGAQPESQVKALVDKLIGEAGGAAPDTGSDLDAAKYAAESGDTATASAIYTAILREEPENPEAIGGLARCLIGAGQLAEAKAWLEKAPKSTQSHLAVTGAQAALALAEESGDLGDPARLQARLTADAADHDARYRLATIQFLRGQSDQAIEELLRIVKADRAWEDDRARKQVVRFFEALGPKHASTLKGRRLLSTVLFS